MLNARVTVVNKVGHKFPSGVGFRRAFMQFSVLDVNNKVLWSSGRTNGAGVIVDEKGDKVDGELWWDDNCKQVDPEKRVHQPHYQQITRQNQVQIYQELVSTPGNEAKPMCGPTADPKGQLTTSFLSICAKVKDNRILPQGFLPLTQRLDIARQLGANADMAEESGPDKHTEHDPDYQRGGSDSLVYRVPLARNHRAPRGRAGDALLSGDAAVLSAGPLLHVEERRHQAALLSRRQGRPDRIDRGKLEAARGDQRAGDGAVELGPQTLMVRSAAQQRVSKHGPHRRRAHASSRGSLRRSSA